MDRVMTDAVRAGVGHCRASGSDSDGRHVTVEGRRLLNFGSCSYLGLELDPRVVDAAIDVSRRFGIHTSSSRAYLSSPLYRELESLLKRVFEAHVVVTQSTTLGHLSALPALVDEDDAILLDHQVHSSVQLACRVVQGTGTHVEILRHNHMERLEKRVARLAGKHRQVWYMADGVYSMFGDLAPVPALVDLMSRHPSLRCYVDDAHGMSWCGPRGSGSVLRHGPLHERMVLATSLGKGFGTGGGAIVLPDAEQARRVQTCGPTMIFGGPIQPPTLGAAIASARLHLCDEIDRLQRELGERMALCEALFRERALPVVSSPETPIGFVATGPTEASQILCRRLMGEGFFTNPAQFPATPARRSGGRFLLTRHQTAEDIERLVDAIDRHWEPSVRAAGAKPEEIWKAFDLEPPVAAAARRMAAAGEGLQLERAESIDKLDVAEWDALMADRGCLASEGLRVFEAAFPPDAARPEDRWEPRYYIARGAAGDPLAATVFTKALWKADMLAPDGVSREVEARREEDPYFLTQWVFGMGCLLSEGEHLWLRPGLDGAVRDAAVRAVLETMRADAQALACELRVVRDLRGGSPLSRALEPLLEAEGLLRLPAPDGHVLSPVPVSDDEMMAGLGRDHRRHQRRAVRPFDEAFTVEVAGRDGRPLGPGEAGRLHALYRNVKARSLTLNTFALPGALIERIAEAPGWELLVFRDRGDEGGEPVGFVASRVGSRIYTPLFAGLDYDAVRERGLYRQVIRQAIGRARDLGCQSVELGFGASLEKRRFGARAVPVTMYVEADDHYAFDALAQIAGDGG